MIRECFPEEGAADLHLERQLRVILVRKWRRKEKKGVPARGITMGQGMEIS